MRSHSNDEIGRRQSGHCQVKFWREPRLGGLELLHGAYSLQSFPRHTHEEYVLGVMVGGAEVLSLGGKTEIAHVGSVLMINPGVWHSNRSLDEAGFAYRTLYPSVDLLKRFASEIAGKEQDAPCLKPQAVIRDEMLSRLLLSLHLALEQNASSLEQETRFVDALVHLLSHYSAAHPARLSQQPERQYVRRVRDYLEAQYATNLSLTELGDLTGISPYHLLRMFRDEVGIPPHEYQTHIRIAQAKRLLRGGWSAGQVAAEVGFVDQSHLTRHFKRIVGLTPGQFALNRKNVQDMVAPPGIE